ncbi:sensor histidine kinase [Microlunatus parietis]
MIAALTIALLVIGASFSFTAPGAEPLSVVLQVGGSALFLAAGLIAWRRRPHNRIGPLMLLTGLSMWLAELSLAPVPLLAAVGTIASALPLAMTLHLVLAFPSGRVRGRLAGSLVVIGYVTSLVLQIPIYLIGDGPLAVTNSVAAQPWLAATMAAQTVIGVSSLLLAALLIGQRAMRSDRVERRLLGPVVWYRIASLLIIGAAAVIVRLPVGPELMLITPQLQLAAILGLPLVFLIGLLFGSFGRAGEVDEMVARIGAAAPSTAQLTAAVADALGDAGAVVVFARIGEQTFVDAAGREIDVETDPARRLHPVRYDERIVGGIYYRHGLIADESLLEVMAGIVAMAIDQQRLVAEQRALVADLRVRETELQNSRRRLLRAEDAERRRVARDLHDGAQQHLVVLGMNARRLSRTSRDPHVIDAAAEIADNVTGVLTEFRDLIAGIMPAPLLDRGLVPAVELLAERMPVPTRVTVRHQPERLAADLESTLYFLVSESLTNVAKHAAASTAEVIIDKINDYGPERLTVTIVDDGSGGADPAGGTGLRGIADRVATVGGTLDVTSVAGAGSSVRAEVPCG